jgi:protein-S-isoprenylcysteine O-methyltransferase Ste14
MKQKHWIDSHKGATGPAVLLMMAATHAWDNPIAWIYLALHGTYGLLWITKSRFFGDRQWEQPASLAYGLLIWGSLSLYWVSPWLIVTGRAPVPPVGMCVFIYVVGVFFHFVSDMQKHLTLTLRPGTLLTDGLWGKLRNPNYFGELLIYLGFGLLPMHWAPLSVLALFIVAVWIPNMVKKDRSLSRYPRFAAYKQESKLFIPFLV